MGGAVMPNALFDPSVLTAVGIAFWSFVAIVVVAGILYAYARDREIQKTIRFAIEKGAQIDAALVDKIMAGKGKSGKPEDYYLGGILCIATGLGLPILVYFLGRIEQEAFFPLTGVGILVLLIGLSLIICGNRASLFYKGAAVGD
jgi:hypothetical protein